MIKAMVFAGLRFDGVKTALLANTWRPSPRVGGNTGGSTGDSVIPDELTRHFHAVVQSCEEGAIKPDPALYHATASIGPSSFPTRCPRW